MRSIIFVTISLLFFSCQKKDVIQSEIDEVDFYLSGTIDGQTYDERINEQNMKLETGSFGLSSAFFPFWGAFKKDINCEINCQEELKISIIVSSSELIASSGSIDAIFPVGSYSYVSNANESLTEVMGQVLIEYIDESGNLYQSIIDPISETNQFNISRVESFTEFFTTVALLEIQFDADLYGINGETIELRNFEGVIGVGNF